VKGGGGGGGGVRRTGKADPLLSISHVERAYNPGGSGKPNAAFNSEVRAAAFLQLDRFIVLASGAKLYLYKYVPSTPLNTPQLSQLAC